MDLETIGAQLEDFQHGCVETQNDAKRCLANWAEEDMGRFMELVSEIFEGNISPIDVESRLCAGRIIKTYVEKHDQMIENWFSISQHYKRRIHSNLLSALSAKSLSIHSLAAEILGEVAVVDPPDNLLTFLLNEVTRTDSTSPNKMAALDAIAHIYTKIAPTNDVLELVIATAINEKELRRGAVECLARISSTYSQLFEPYLKVMLNLTSEVLQADAPNIIQQITHFWMNTCIEEYKLQNYVAPYLIFDVPAHAKLVERSIFQLVPILLKALVKLGTYGNDMADVDSCLGKITLVVGDFIFPLIVPFLNDNLSSSSWELRKASIHVLGCISVGNNKKRLSVLVSDRLGTVLNGLRDDNYLVRLSAGWTLQKIFKNLISSEGFPILTASNMVRVLDALHDGSLDNNEYVRNIVSKATHFLHKRYCALATAHVLEHREFRRYGVDVAPHLLRALNSNAEIRHGAEIALGRLRDQNLQEFWLALSLELSSDLSDPGSQMLAGVMLKNSFDSNGSRSDSHEWSSTHLNYRSLIKQLILVSLESPCRRARHGAAQVFAKMISFVERELLGLLLNHIDRNPYLKQGCIETFEYLFEEKCLSDNEIGVVLEEVIRCLDNSEDREVRLCALRALQNALDYSAIDQEMVKKKIMTVILGSFGFDDSLDIDIMEGAFKCLVSIACGCYSIHRKDMMRIIQLTYYAFDDYDETLVRQALEFWSVICERELDSSTHFHRMYIKEALPLLMPLLLQILCENVPEEWKDWEDGASNMERAGGTCLALVANMVGDEVWPSIMEFFTENFRKSDSRYHRAALNVIGYMVELMPLERLSVFLNSKLEMLLDEVIIAASQNSHKNLRLMARWVLCQMLEKNNLGSKDGVPMDRLQQIVRVLLQGLKESPQVAAEGICSLVRGYQGTEPLFTPFLPEIFHTLIQVAECDFNIRSSVYGALTDIVSSLHKSEISHIIQRLFPDIMSKLHGSIELQLQMMSARERQHEVDLQGHLCGVLKASIEKLYTFDETKPEIRDANEAIMHLLDEILTKNIVKEALLALSALITATGPEFEYMARVSAILVNGLSNDEDYEAVVLSAQIIGEISSVLEGKMTPYCDQIMTALLGHLMQERLDDTSKIVIISSIGDIARAVGVEFKKYVVPVISVLEDWVGNPEKCIDKLYTELFRRFVEV